MTAAGSIEAGPHYTVGAGELAAWVEAQGPDLWWDVDGDPLLTGRLSTPCPADELAAALRKVARPLLVQAKPGDADARGQAIDADRLDALTSRFSENVSYVGSPPPGADDRLLYMRWQNSPVEWLLIEDTVTAAAYRAEAAPQPR